MAPTYIDLPTLIHRAALEKVRDRYHKGGVFLDQDTFDQQQKPADGPS